MIDYVYVTSVRRSASAPDLTDEDDTLMVSQDYNNAMDEIQRHKTNIRQFKIHKKYELQQEEYERQLTIQQALDDEPIDQLQVHQYVKVRVHFSVPS